MLLLLLLHLLVLLVIPLVFKRGTFLFRTLIPSYPLFVFCIGTMLRNVESVLMKKNRCFLYGTKCLLFVVCCLLFVVFLKCVDVKKKKNEWCENYKIKGCVYSGVDGTGPCWSFYELQKANMEK